MKTWGREIRKGKKQGESNKKKQKEEWENKNSRKRRGESERGGWLGWWTVAFPVSSRVLLVLSHRPCSAPLLSPLPFPPSAPLPRRGLLLHERPRSIPARSAFPATGGERGPTKASWSAGKIPHPFRRSLLLPFHRFYLIHSSLDEIKKRSCCLLFICSCVAIRVLLPAGSFELMACHASNLLNYC